MKESEQTRMTTTSKKSRKELSPARCMGALLHEQDSHPRALRATPHAALWHPLGTNATFVTSPWLLPRPKTLGSLHSLMSARLSRRIFTRPLCALLSKVIWGEGGRLPPTKPGPYVPTRVTVTPPEAGSTHGDGEGVAVGDLIVDDGLDVDGFQLELDGDVNESEGRDIR